MSPRCLDDRRFTLYIRFVLWEEESHCCEGKKKERVARAPTTPPLQGKEDMVKRNPEQQQQQQQQERGRQTKPTQTNHFPKQKEEVFPSDWKGGRVQCRWCGPVHDIIDYGGPPRPKLLHNLIFDTSKPPPSPRSHHFRCAAPSLSRHVIGLMT